MAMYNEKGGLRGRFKNPTGAINLADVEDDDYVDYASMQDQASRDAQRRAELMVVLDDKSPTENKQTNKMKEV